MDKNGYYTPIVLVIKCQLFPPCFLILSEPVIELSTTVTVLFLKLYCIEFLQVFNLKRTVSD